MDKFFSVEVGSTPATALAGFLGDDGKPEGFTTEVNIGLGQLAVPNYSLVWGEQVKDKKGIISGEIKFLDWNDVNGYVIQTRYHPSCPNSIDLEYQRDIKKLPNPRDEYAELGLSTGINDFDPIRDKTKILMIKYHYMNGANKSRDPQMVEAFRTYDAQGKINIKVTSIENKIKVQTLVLSAKDDKVLLKILASTFGMDLRTQDHILFEELLQLTEKPDYFLNVMNTTKAEYEFLYLKAKDVGVLVDDGLEEIMVVENGSKRLLITIKDSGVYSKENYILINWYKPDNFNALVDLKRVYKEYEESVLQH